MGSREIDPGRPGTPPPSARPLIMALPVQLSPHGTMRVPPNEHVIVHRTDTGRLQVGIYFLGYSCNCVLHIYIPS